MKIKPNPDYVPPPHYAVPKSSGDAPVQAWIALVPPWQGEFMRRIDAVATREVPNLHKAVRWHAVWYGVTGGAWMLAISSLKRHLKLVFMDGDHLVPRPPVFLKSRPNLALDLRESDSLDEALLADWLRQAARLPGWGRA